jgi:coenzyme PQQ precursor peptide PqqA
VLSGYFAITPTQVARDGYRNARLRDGCGGSSLLAVRRRAETWRSEMAWKTPKIVEVPVGMEINMYACAARK